MVSFAVVSDVHLGHRNTPTDFIIHNLYNYLLSPKRLNELDILFIAGDLFDRLLYLPDADAISTYRFLIKLLRLCSKHDIVLRILEGTPSHDRSQSKLILDYKESLDIDVDVQYYNDIGYEVIDRLDRLKVVYIPENIRSNVLVTLSEIKHIYDYERINKADIVIAHGFHEKQLPYIKNTRHAYTLAQLSSLAEYGVFIGHVHTRTRYDNVYAQGSFDRLKFGEEENKGYYYGILDKATYQFDCKFIVNENAMIYKTYDLRNDQNIDGLLKRIAQNSTLYHNYRFIIDQDSSSDIYQKLMYYKTKTVARKYVIEIKLEEAPIEVSTIDTYETIEINATTLPDILSHRLQEMNYKHHMRCLEKFKKLDELKSSIS